MADIQSTLVGGAIGFFSSLLTQIIIEPIKNRIYGPKLEVRFIDGDKAFVTDTKENGVTEAHYVRLRVVNTGRQIAKQCRAYLVNVEKWNTSAGNFEPTIYCDSLQLAWSAQANVQEAYRPLDMAKEIRQFIDVASTRESENDYRIMTKPHLFRYEPLFKEQGRFRYTVQVSGDNVKPTSAKLIFDWRGHWHNFAVSAD